MGFANILTTVLGFFKSLFTYLNNKKLMDAGKADAELEGRKEMDAKVTDIANARADDSVRKSTKTKYKRP